MSRKIAQDSAIFLPRPIVAGLTNLMFTYREAGLAASRLIMAPRRIAPVGQTSERQFLPAASGRRLGLRGAQY